MADTPRKPRAIMLVDFQEEITANGRKLLSCIFKDRYADWTYRWTPPWRDTERERGVERVFLRAIEVEEWNDPEGVWDTELKKAAEASPALKEFQLPVQVKCGTLATVDEEGWAYRMHVTITQEGNLFEAVAGRPYSSVSITQNGFRIGTCDINYERFKNDVLAHFGPKWEFRLGTQLWKVKDDLLDVGVFFQVWIPDGLSRQDYRVIGTEIASFVRSYLRRVLGDYESLTRGFED